MTITLRSETALVDGGYDCAMARVSPTRAALVMWDDASHQAKIFLLDGLTGAVVDSAGFGPAGEDFYLAFGDVSGFPGLQLISVEPGQVVALLMTQDGTTSENTHALYSFRFTGDSIPTPDVEALETTSDDQVEWFVFPAGPAAFVATRGGGPVVDGGIATATFEMHAVSPGLTVSGVLDSWDFVRSGFFVNWVFHWTDLGDGRGILYRGDGDYPGLPVSPELVAVSPSSITRTTLTGPSSWAYGEQPARNYTPGIGAAWLGDDDPDSDIYTLTVSGGALATSATALSPFPWSWGTQDRLAIAYDGTPVVVRDVSGIGATDVGVVTPTESADFSVTNFVEPATAVLVGTHLFVADFYGNLLAFDGFPFATPTVLTGQVRANRVRFRRAR